MRPATDIAVNIIVIVIIVCLQMVIRIAGSFREWAYSLNEWVQKIWGNVLAVLL